jgi:hypothetical protein
VMLPKQSCVPVRTLWAWHNRIDHKKSLLGSKNPHVFCEGRSRVESHTRTGPNPSP